MQMLRLGHVGFTVELLQRLLNKAVARDGTGAALLDEDGRFGPKTDAAARAFQSRHRPLKVDGLVGRATWGALGLRHDVDHARIRPFGQPNCMTCWTAAATMILGNQSVGPGSASLEPQGGLAGTIENVGKFAQGLGWRMLNHSPNATELIGLLRGTPLWLSGGGASWAHAVVLSGVWSDGDVSGDGTMFRIHDPWPVNVGRVYGSFANPITVFSSNGVTRVSYSLSYVLVPR